ncbi:MAG: Cu(I)/Ag(I) efflux system membrane fusion protein, partial [Arenicella sp.]
TRTAKVRIELDNANGDLQPGAYADITLGFAKQARLSIVSEAVLRDSRGNHVILALGAGRFGTRSVTTGIAAQGRTEILAGLEAGDLVVASGQFMLDSEVNLREGLSKLSSTVRPTTRSTPPTRTSTNLSSHGSKIPLSDIGLDAKSLSQIDHFVDMALYFHETLINGKAVDPSFVDPAIALAEVLSQRYPESELVLILEQSKGALIGAQTSLESQALAADLARLMQAIKPWILDAAPQHYADLGLTLYRQLSTDQLWLQKDGVIGNPYGDGESEAVAWPRPTSGSGTGTTGTGTTGLLEIKLSVEAEQTADPHAGHR